MFHESDHIICSNNISQTVSLRISLTARITSKEGIKKIDIKLIPIILLPNRSNGEKMIEVTCTCSH